MSHADKVIEAVKAMTPEERVQSLISAGIIREDGTLMPRYGGTPTSGDVPTPETDAATYDSGDETDPSMRPFANGYWVKADFARDLAKFAFDTYETLEQRRKEIAATGAQLAECQSKLAATTARAEELTTACKEACGKLAEHVAHDMDHRQKDHSRWYKAVQRVRELLDFQP